MAKTGMSMEQYRALSPEAKAALKAERKEKAIASVKTGAFPTGVRVKIGEFTLTCRPSGVSEKGSVSYSHPPMVLNIGGRNVRINQVSISVLNDTTPELSDADLEAGEVL